MLIVPMGGPSILLKPMLYIYVRFMIIVQTWAKKLYIKIFTYNFFSLVYTKMLTGTG